MKFRNKTYPITPKKESAIHASDVHPNKIKTKSNLKRTKKSTIPFLVDENILGIARHLESFDIKFRSIGDPDCPPRGSDDPTVAKFAKKYGFVVVTNDDKLQKQCESLDVPCIVSTLSDLARKVKAYANSH
ncbi:MAG: hypothetical protein K5798_03850 [Nitrosopumilus sp.]|uniref:hypothetical protein n=1 Tax=Nitrosopumilus sp. TaxID=2024843 RepID=UPI0024307510|nr:hypothetical protein [Nitrosopumilus sp.]MCV0366386.1 hypothetical protein [Nitrosopumilus sp.]